MSNQSSSPATSADATRLGVRITTISMVAGGIVPVPADGIVVFVGPNNAGKSAALREVHLGLIRDPNVSVPEMVVAQGVTADKEGDQVALMAWLDDHARRENAGSGDIYRGITAQIHETVAPIRWQQGPPFAELGAFFALYLPAGTGQNAVNPPPSFNVMAQAPTHPVQMLYLNVDLELALRSIARRAFGTDIVVNRFGGNQIPIHVGRPPQFVGEPGLPSRSFLDELFALPLLQDQGDGMKSFLGQMIYLVATDFPFVIIDEPEAFLHPPQARLLGRLLNEYKPPHSQVFLATHDSHILRGLLDGDDSHVTVVRLSRPEGRGKFSQLDPDSVRRLWNDPILRYSNILEGLFHRAVILCESDSDCRFYGSVIDTMGIEESTEILITHCNGKHRMPVVVRALSAVAVPVSVIADFDLLREIEPLRSLVNQLGGDWSAIEAPWRQLKAALDSEIRRPSRDYVGEQIRLQLEASGDPILSDRDMERIREVTRSEGGWDKVKRGGSNAVPQGQAMQNLEELAGQLSAIGIHVVPVGELERWVSRVPGHGPDWVSEVHAQGIYATAEVEPVRIFLGPIIQRALSS